jgi:hypothetical protein
MADIAGLEFTWSEGSMELKYDHCKMLEDRSWKHHLAR